MEIFCNTLMSICLFGLLVATIGLIVGLVSTEGKKHNKAKS
jgi:hypothetical protein